MGDNVARSNEFLKSYPAVIIGLVALLAGAAAGGVSLTLAGEDADRWAVVLTVVAVAGIGGGLALLVVVFHRPGGLLRARTTDQERRTYRDDYRAGRPETDADKSRSRRV
ncbi:hypothetical protein ACN27E_13840 [Mycobacterium sp. WMMD1722]|uniref:hypothetical protein n=1 Tax=Mycobacterium sp. WMMD1722 TaxID=3404117 RepID=UPI003BF618EB